MFSKAQGEYLYGVLKVSPQHWHDNDLATDEGQYSFVLLHLEH